MSVSSVKERHACSRTLVAFLMSLGGKKVRIELQNDTIVAGTLENVDSQMK